MEKLFRREEIRGGKSNIDRKESTRSSSGKSRVRYVTSCAKLLSDTSKYRGVPAMFDL